MHIDQINDLITIIKMSFEQNVDFILLILSQELKTQFLIITVSLITKTTYFNEFSTKDNFYIS